MAETSPASEQELFERAFGGLDAFPLNSSSEPITCDHLLELGRDMTASAVLAVALTEQLSDHSKAVLRDLYMALSEREVRGDYALEIRQRRPGKRRGEIAELGEMVDDAITAKFVQFAEQALGKKEAAVAQVAALKKVSRASIFRSLRRHQQRESHDFE